jgi:hypothetical protein
MVSLTTENPPAFPLQPTLAEPNWTFVAPVKPFP